MSESPEVREVAEAEVVDLGDLDLDDRSVAEGPARRVERARERLAYLMLGLLAIVVLVMLLLLYQDKLTPEDFAAIAGVLISPIVGLLGAATGYYYGRSDR